MLRVARMSMVALVGCVSATARAQTPAERVTALPDPGDDAWDAAVALVLVDTFDEDGSGLLSSSEAAAVPCAVWVAADEAVRAGWGSGLYTVYGFDVGKRWVGASLGLEASVRTDLAARLSLCGLGPEFEAPGPAGKIRALADGGSDGWDRAVTRVMLEAHDEDGSGTIDRSVEVASITCATWEALDAGVRNAWTSGLYLTYGLAPDLLWVGGAIGMSEDVRDAVVSALRGCDIEGAHEEAHVPTDPAVVADALGQLPRAGSAPWTEVVRMTMLRLFDGNSSGDLDEAAELDAVPCRLWDALDGALHRDGRGGLLAAYGFHVDARWRGYALGVQGSARELAAQTIGRCGLAPRDVVAAPAATSLGVQDASPARAKAWLLRYDLDGSGSIDTRAEVVGVPCGAWRELERAARTQYGVGAVDLYGFRRGATFTGDSVGVHAKVGRVASKRVVMCTARHD